MITIGKGKARWVITFPRDTLWQLKIESIPESSKVMMEDTTTAKACRKNISMTVEEAETERLSE